MIVTNDPQGPALDPRVDVGVHIIRLPSRQAVAASRGCSPDHPDVMAEASALAGPARPTDIVVFDHQPWHKVDGALRAHPQVHIDYPETILKISFGKQERAVWWSTEPFTITKIERHHPPLPNSSQYPFDGPDPPYDARTETVGAGLVFAMRAQPIRKAAIGQMYKISFVMAGELIDPDMEGAP